MYDIQLNSFLIIDLLFVKKLIELNLSYIDSGRFIGQLVSTLLEKESKCRLEIFRLESNQLSHESIQWITKYLLSENSFYLKVLSLNDNPICDVGVIEICNTLYTRHKLISDYVKARRCDSMLNYQLPLQKLFLKKVKMSDKGLNSLKHNLDLIN